MRTARVTLDSGPGHYHAFSRAYNHEFRFTEDYKDIFRDLMWRTAAYSGITICTYNIMDNHFHIQLFENHPADLSDDGFRERLAQMYLGRSYKKEIAPFERYLKAGDRVSADLFKKKHTVRMNSLSEFMKTLCQRFTQIYNRREKCSGTFWNDRFGSVLIEPKPGALAVMAAYIDLNPLRAGMVDDPLKHRWCGYADAVSGHQGARDGLRHMLSFSDQFSRVIDEDSEWAEVQATYRKWLYAKGAGNSDPRNGKLKKGFTAEDIAKVLEQGGALPLNTLIRCTIQSFTRGLIFGSKSFVEEHLDKAARRCGWKRERSPQSIPGSSDAQFTVLRL